MFLEASRLHTRAMTLYFFPLFTLLMVGGFGGTRIIEMTIHFESTPGFILPIAFATTLYFLIFVFLFSYSHLVIRNNLKEGEDVSLLGLLFMDGFSKELNHRGLRRAYLFFAALGLMAALGISLLTKYWAADSPSLLAGPIGFQHIFFYGNVLYAFCMCLLAFIRGRPEIGIQKAGGRVRFPEKIIRKSVVFLAFSYFWIIVLATAIRFSESIQTPTVLSVTTTIVGGISIFGVTTYFLLLYSLRK